MSFTDGKTRKVTSEDLSYPWYGSSKAKKFRCRLCGHKFILGDDYRFVYTNYKSSKCHYGNFLVCADCDGVDVIDRAVAQEKEADQRFWWYRGGRNEADV